MAIDKNAKYTFAEWIKIVAENANIPYQGKIEKKIEKKDVKK